MKAHFILYVADQRKSTDFYSKVLNSKPTLDVPGMTEFALGAGVILGLMPAAGAERLLGTSTDTGAAARAELYLIVDSPQDFHARAIAAGARELSPFAERDWGHRAAYSIDVDGNVIAFAEEITGFDTEQRSPS